MGARIRSACILALAAWSLAGCQSSKEKAAAHAQMATQLADAGRLREARVEMNKAIAERDDDPRLYLLQAQILIGNRDIVGAYQSYKNGLALDPANVEMLAAVAGIAFRVGQYDEAKDYANLLLTFAPNALAAYQVKSLVALQRRQIDEAKLNASKVLELAPDDESARLVMARALALEGKKKESLEALADLASQSKASIAVQSTLLNLYRDNREPVHMQQVLERMLADQPENVENRIDYANLLYKTGQTAAARTQVVTLLNGRVPTIKYYDQAIRLWAEYDAAPLPPPLLREIADKANVHSTPAVLLYFLLNGKRQIGEEILSRMSPAMRETMKPIIGRYQFADGQVAAARATASAVLEDDPLNVDGLILAGQIALLDRQAQKAINLLEQAISNDPLNPGAYMALTQAYLAKGVDWRARQVLEESLKKMPQNHDLFDFAVGLLTRLGDTNRARAVAERFTKDSSSSARAWQRLARACPPKDSFCAGFAQKGLEASRQSYLLDDPPGTPVDRGLFGRL